MSFFEEQVERWVELQYDRLDDRFLKGELTQEEYNAQTKLLTNEAEQKYREQISGR